MTKCFFLLYCLNGISVWCDVNDTYIRSLLLFALCIYIKWILLHFHEQYVPILYICMYVCLYKAYCTVHVWITLHIMCICMPELAWLSHLTYHPTSTYILYVICVCTNSNIILSLTSILPLGAGIKLLTHCGLLRGFLLLFVLCVCMYVHISLFSLLCVRSLSKILSPRMTKRFQFSLLMITFEVS